MTIDTEVFPIRSIRRVIQVISILMMDGEEVPVLVVKFPSAPAADETMDLERSLPVVTVRETRLLQLFHGFIDRFAGAFFPRFWISSILDFFNHDGPLPCVLGR